MTTKQQKIVVESLDEIRRTNGGLLRPLHVVSAAKSAKHPLHGHFCWDDGKAAHRYRLLQARWLIKVSVTILEPDTKPVPVFVSLVQDRKQQDGGYRALVDVMSDADLRAKLLSQAFAEFDSWQAKYHALEQLAPIFAAAEKAKRKAKHARRPARRTA